MFWLIFILLLFSACNAIRITKIQNIIIVGNIYNTLLNVTEDQCICEMIKVNDAICALNYFSTNQTCQLYRSNSSTIFVEFHLNSTIIFLYQSSILILDIQEYQPITSSSTPTAILLSSPSSASPSASPSAISSSSSTTTSSSTSTSTTTSTTSKTTSTTTACNFFLNQTTYSVGLQPMSVAVADVNSDNKPDIVVANQGSNTVSVLLNAGSGTFNAATNYTVGGNPFSVAVVDVNSDNKPDIVVANFFGGTIGVLLNAGIGTFNAQTTYAVGTYPYSVAVVDVNSDNKPDIVVANYGSNNVGVLLNTGNGTFNNQTTYPVGSSPYSVAIVDVNSDNEPDIVVVNYDPPYTVSVLLHC
ncbi:unnamed protein product [Adineta steineri]|uniref:Uncharacterized protein n=1 Tax=Adineta steineri TaxID=433720 RepID=A0A815K9I6_9BILA|nr:unnamed protein product [Adineta steineri]CAF1392659.1 unnamed protein product [Adineta steineri]